MIYYLESLANAALSLEIIAGITLASQLPTEIRYQLESFSVPNALKGTTAKLAWFSKNDVI